MNEDDWFLEGEETWASAAIDDTDKVIAVVKDFLARAIAHDGTNSELLRAQQSLSELQEDGWPSLDIDHWLQLFGKYKEHSNVGEQDMLEKFKAKYL